MGFFKKIFKGIGKVFKKIGKGIKKAFKKFGKFMNKIGIVGQIAMMFILPGVGNALLSSFGTMASNMAGLTGAFKGLSGIAGAVVKGAGTILKGAHQFVSTGLNAFKTVTNGITEFGKTALNKIPGINIEGAAQNFFGKGDSVLSRIKLDADRIFDPFKKSITVTEELLGQGPLSETLSKTTGYSQEVLTKDLGNVNLNGLKVGDTVNLDFGAKAIDGAKINQTINSRLVADETLKAKLGIPKDMTIDDLRSVQEGVNIGGVGYDPNAQGFSQSGVNMDALKFEPNAKVNDFGISMDSLNAPDYKKMLDTTTSAATESLLGPSTLRESLTQQIPTGTIDPRTGEVAMPSPFKDPLGYAGAKIEQHGGGVKGVLGALGEGKEFVATTMDTLGLNQQEEFDYGSQGYNERILLDTFPVQSSEPISSLMANIGPGYGLPDGMMSIFRAMQDNYGSASYRNTLMNFGRMAT